MTKPNEIIENLEQCTNGKEVFEYLTSIRLVEVTKLLEEFNVSPETSKVTGSNVSLDIINDFLDNYIENAFTESVEYKVTGNSNFEDFDACESFYISALIKLSMTVCDDTDINIIPHYKHLKSSEMSNYVHNKYEDFHIAAKLLEEM